MRVRLLLQLAMRSGGDIPAGLVEEKDLDWFNALATWNDTVSFAREASLLCLLRDDGRKGRR